MYCRVCGKELPDDAARCDECGAPTDGSDYSGGRTDGSQPDSGQPDSGQPDSGQYQSGGDSQGGSGGSSSWGDSQGNGSYYQDNRYRYSGYSQYDNGEQPVYEQQSGARKGFAITSMVIGIIGLVGTCCSLMTWGFLSILLGIVGLVFGILGLKSQGRGMAIAGIIMACLNILIGILMFVLLLVASQAVSGMSPEDLEEFFNEAYGLELVSLRNWLP